MNRSEWQSSIFSVLQHVRTVRRHPFFFLSLIALHFLSKHPRDYTLFAVQLLMIWVTWKIPCAAVCIYIVQYNATLIIRQTAGIQNKVSCSIFISTRTKFNCVGWYWRLIIGRVFDDGTQFITTCLHPTCFNIKDIRRATSLCWLLRTVHRGIWGCCCSRCRLHHRWYRYRDHTAGCNAHYHRIMYHSLHTDGCGSNTIEGL